MSEYKENQAIVYTDGACSGSSGVGGWAYLILCDGCITKSSGGNRGRTTCNAMELKALCEVMVVCKNMEVKEVKICSDSAYVINSFNNIEKWFRNGWRRKNGRFIKNKSLWKRVHGILKDGMKVEFEKVKAHSGDRYNDIVDSLAKGAIKDVDSREDS